MENRRDLAVRFKEFHLRTIRLLKLVRVNSLNSWPISQAVASSGSAGANYLEATEPMSKKDFVKCLKISRKELKEFDIWIAGIKESAEIDHPEFDLLVQEAKELGYILTSIIVKTDSK